MAMERHASGRMPVLRCLVALIALLAGGVTVCQAGEPAPSGCYGIDADCKVENGVGICWVGVTDLRTGEELFRPRLSGRLGAEASWNAAAELEDGRYAFGLKAIVNESAVLVELVVERDKVVIGHQRLRMRMVRTLQD
jgi:hypothetical protein